MPKTKRPDRDTIDSLSDDAQARMDRARTVLEYAGRDWKDELDARELITDLLHLISDHTSPQFMRRVLEDCWRDYEAGDTRSDQ